MAQDVTTVAVQIDENQLIVVSGIRMRKENAIPVDVAIRTYQRCK